MYQVSVGQHDPTPDDDDDDDDDDLVHEMDQISIQDIQSRDIDIIFTSPETVLGTQRDVIEDLTKEKILKKKTFRRAYGTLGELRALAPGIPVIALTATATNKTNREIVLCSTSFSMGLDLQSVETVIHYGPASNVEGYIQETGRAGRDPEKQAHALLMKFRQCLSGRRNISDEMKQYVRTNNAILEYL
ncbi:uncharacterized protein LOC124136953 [Haliotis rufescens]|uniref:uncharacterized protein LOC124136953 n=1 Tax=Haliotis rufescens TaxID=6454 RepID=UPI00201F3E8D|nr:uncharacterized protein LOC124136953 [Haliotis rufescens]